MKQQKRYCPRVLSLLLSDDFKEGFIAVSRMRCKQWDCEFCGKKNGEMWRAHLLHTLTGGFSDGKWVFLTITAAPNSHITPKTSLDNLKRGWGKLHDRLRYYCKRTLSYVMMYEPHRNGAFHIHAIVDAGREYDAWNWPSLSGLTKKSRVKYEKRHPLCVWLKNACIKSGMGFMVHMTRVHEGQTGADNVRLAVAYVTKYFTKEVASYKFPKGWRRLGTSRDIGSPQTKREKKFTWRVRSYISSDEVRLHPHYLIQENRELDASDFGDVGIYPDENPS